MLAALHDRAQRGDGLPDLVVGGVQRDRGETDHVWGAEVRDDAARLKRLAELDRLRVLQRHVPTPTLWLARRPDREAVRLVREVAVRELDQPARQIERFRPDPRDAGLYPYAALLAVTAFCGASILWITAFDMRTRGTSGRMRPVRTFDIAIGLALLAPALYAFWLISGALGL